MKTGIYILVATLILIDSFTLNAQNDSSHKNLNITVFLNGSYNYKTEISRRDIAGYSAPIFEEKIVEIGNISIALEKRLNNSFRHEFEIMPVRYNYTNNLEYVMISENSSLISISSTGKSTLFESAFRYQFKYCFNEDKPIVPQIGVSSQLYYYYFKNEPAISRYYALTEQRIGLRFSIVPGMVFNLNNHLAVDINMALYFYEFGFNYSFYENPNLSLDEAKETILYRDILPAYVCGRIGIIYRFAK